MMLGLGCSVFVLSRLPHAVLLHSFVLYHHRVSRHDFSYFYSGTAGWDSDIGSFVVGVSFHDRAIAQQVCGLGTVRNRHPR
jgi:hypothetical protein